MQFIDYYKILGVEPNADDKAIKTAYRKLAHKYHPDINKEPGAEDKFKEVAEAYEVLKNPEKRAEFDQLRQFNQQGGSFRAPPNWQNTHSDNQNFHFESNGDFSDFFESIFGGGRTHSASQGFNAQRAGQDIEMELPIFLEEAISGDSKTISYKIPSMDQQGHRTETVKSLNIKIPKGVTSGEKIRLKGQGAPGINGGPSGDLYLIIKFAPHPKFDVQGYDLTISLPVTPWEAALGAKITVPTLDKSVTINIPQASQAGQKFRLKGKGLPTKTEGQAGNLFLVLKIVMPPILNEQSKALWQQLAEQNPFDPRKEGSK